MILVSHILRVVEWYAETRRLTLGVGIHRAGSLYCNTHAMADSDHANNPSIDATVTSHHGKEEKPSLPGGEEQHCDDDHNNSHGLDQYDQTVQDPAKSRLTDEQHMGAVHHLTRHWLPPDERGSRAIHILGAASTKDAESIIRNMAQRELRFSFEQVYGTKTKSFNNIWLRRKLFEAIGSQAGSLRRKGRKKVVASTMKRRVRKPSNKPRSPFPPAPYAPPLFKQGHDISNMDNNDTEALQTLASIASEDARHPS